MARGINKVILVGNLGQDPDVRYTPSNSAVVNISIATADSWMDKNSGQRQERTEWHRVVMFNRLAEIAGEYLRKGSQVYIEGKLQTRKWTDQNGQDRYSTEIVANEMQMMGGRSGGDTSFNAPPPSAPRQQAAPNPQQQNPSQPPAAQPDFGPEPDFDDDIPF